MFKNRIVFSGIFIGLVTLVTMIFIVPVGSVGYFNLGDVVIMLIALVVNPVQAMFIGGIGSFLADMLSGYAVYAPFTLVIKGLEGLIIAYLFRKMKRQHAWLALLAGGLVITVGYPLADMWISQSVEMFYPSLILNSLQGGIAWIIAVVGCPLFLKVFKNIH